MIEGNSPLERYSASARTFHWLTVALIMVQFTIAWTMPHIGRGSVPVGLIGWHLTIGIAIGILTILRWTWRLVQPPPPPPANLPSALVMLSRATHWLLYGLLIVLPMLGWVNANARGWQLHFLDAIPLPQIVARGSPIGRSMGDVHANLAIVFLAVVALHVVGAAYHAFIRRDDVVRRMA